MMNLANDYFDKLMVDWWLISKIGYQPSICHDESQFAAINNWQPRASPTSGFVQTFRRMAEGHPIRSGPVAQQRQTEQDEPTEKKSVSLILVINEWLTNDQSMVHGG